MPGTVLSMQNIYLVKKNYANPLEGDTKPPEGDNSMKFVYHQLNYLKIWEWELIFGRAVKTISSPGVRSPCFNQSDCFDHNYLTLTNRQTNMTSFDWFNGLELHVGFGEQRTKFKF